MDMECTVFKARIIDVCLEYLNTCVGWKREHNVNDDDLLVAHLMGIEELWDFDAQFQAAVEFLVELQKGTI